MRIVITGGSGQVGQILARHCHSNGHTVAVVARNVRPQPWSTIRWDGQHLGEWVNELNGCDVLVNLAGRSVNCRYNQANRREIKASRIVTTRLVGDAIARSSDPPKLWMNASTATIYRHAMDRPMDEVTGEIGGNKPGIPGTGRFSYDVAITWETSFFTPATQPRTQIP